ncbi:hypothetical protein LJC10_03075 [Selenomonadales bacterium OttesenSCG-928-I06]|nr:hypothetical protein [Selenomonadales bacterium OttesenSCG-928-I06]
MRTLRLQSGLPHFRTAGRVFYRLESVLSWMSTQETQTRKADSPPEYGVLRQVK